jgi:CBS domain-containing protein
MWQLHIALNAPKGPNTRHYFSDYSRGESNRGKRTVDTLNWSFACSSLIEDLEKRVMSILRIAKAPAVAVAPSATVMEAVRRMKDANVGAVAVLDGEVLQGMFSERDVMLRIVLEKRDPETTMVKDVMTTEVVAIRKDTKAEEAVNLMWERHIRHLPVVREDGKVEGIVEIRNLFHERFEDMMGQLDSLEKYIAVDGIGG